MNLTLSLDTGHTVGFSICQIYGLAQSSIFPEAVRKLSDKNLFYGKQESCLLCLIIFISRGPVRKKGIVCSKGLDLTQSWELIKRFMKSWCLSVWLWAESWEGRVK